MTTVFIIFCSSLVAILFMVLNRWRELKTGRAFIPLHFNADQKIINHYGKATEFAKEYPKQLGRVTLYFLVRQSIIFLRQVQKKIYPHFSHIVEAVKGKDVPLGMKKASIFMADVAKHKKRIKKKNLEKTILPATDDSQIEK